MFARTKLPLQQQRVQTIASLFAFNASVTPVRTLVITSMDKWKDCKSYMQLDDKTKAKLVPKPRDGVSTPKEFLSKIGRGCGDVSEKFKSWDHLFQATSEEMADSLAIPVRKRKYILQWREWFKRGLELRAIELPERSKKHLRVKKQVELLRLKKQGLA
ncbi:IGR protein motif-domain-containing protein [Obelidium mucronatum]|nr:IGR protein motif-domain-containing protein [Obelidium mucronatum]